MTSPVPPSFIESLQRSADQQQLQMWQAAQTVRAHISVQDGLESMLDCLGLTDAEHPLALANSAS